MKPMKTLSYRPLNNTLIQALNAYQSRNYLPSLNAAINHALSVFLLESGVYNLSSESEGSAEPPQTPQLPTEQDTDKSDVVIDLDW
jgi:hypothetical protein